MSNQYIKEQDMIISFDLCKINRGKEKLCKCQSPHFEVDTQNRIVMCTDCGAVIDPFDALLVVAEKHKQYSEYQEKALEKYKIYSELAEKERRRGIKNKVFKDMDSNYKQDLFPHCPECQKLINPTEITSWSRKED